MLQKYFYLQDLTKIKLEKLPRILLQKTHILSRSGAVPGNPGHLVTLCVNEKGSRH